MKKQIVAMILAVITVLMCCAFTDGEVKANENIETKTIDKLCSALDCKIEDIAEHIPE